MPPRKRQTKKEAIDEYHVQQQDIATDPKKHVILQLRRRLEEEEQQQPTVCVEDCNKFPTAKQLLSNSSQSACFWCCHEFKHPSIGLPIKYKNNQFYVCGHFCSFECAASFNFNSSELGQNAWESYHLLNTMARQGGITKPVTQASSRLALKMFGGWMDIEEFRSNNVKYRPLPSPMVPVVQVMDEVSNVMVNKPSFVPLDNQRILKAKQNIFNVYKKETIHDKMKLGHAGEEK